MFTGLAEETGTVVETADAGEGRRVVVEADEAFADGAVGDSISVSGACLTLESVGDGRGEFFLAAETLDRTWFDVLAEGDAVNLERCLRPTDRMGGHYVQGHVDATADVVAVEELDEGWNYTFSLPGGVARHVVEKGFIAVDGLSLTVTDVTAETFAVTVIPETYRITNLSEKAVGDRVNVEADVFAKYVERLLEGVPSARR